MTETPQQPEQAEVQPGMTGPAPRPKPRSATGRRGWFGRRRGGRPPRKPKAPRSEYLDILPPEGVPLQFRLATVGGRFGAQFLDILITYGGLLLLFWLIIWSNTSNLSFALSLFFLLTFLVRTPYYVLAELIWNGRTLGKKITRIRVISADGTRLRPHQVVARNLMKDVEVFMPIAVIFGARTGGLINLLLMVWIVAVLLVPVFSRRNQRLGDMIAGTLVVEQPRPKLLPDLAAETPRDAGRAGFSFSRQQLEIYGKFELQTLERILREPPKSPEGRERLTKVAQTIHGKIAYGGVLRAADEWDFMSEFYRQQREFLESRHLFGDTRENKFHDTPGAETGLPGRAGDHGAGAGARSGAEAKNGAK